ncbi:sensor histidine kinase [Sphingobacterium sp. GVS05A]|uniref:sensor histidine kinase n=1 Tax=Sphingobacterium sp. GVS05A TaxID=2862679 RepID=UPI001CBCEEE1|nr:HAMP domain-containing sensor histidine kinase [Sphingobacterium sp. GVS05A]
MNSADRNIYPWAFGASFLLLTVLIGFLIFKTYQLEDKNYQIGQLNLVQNAYGTAIMDDKIFPGGDAVFQTELVPYLNTWYKKVTDKSPGAVQYGETRMELFLKTMRTKQSLDSIFGQIVQQQKLDPALIYLFHFDKLELYNAADNSWQVFYESASDDSSGTISGSLRKTSLNNRVFQLAVSDKEPIPYRFTYSLYVDYENRNWRIIQQMAPVFLLSLACIAVIVLLSFRTYKNWVNQRKLAHLKTSFLNHMRHEFNTPLTTILVSAHSLIDRDANLDNKEVVQLGRIVERQAKRLRDYFEQVMGSVALQEQQPKIIQAPIDLLTREILDELCLRYQGEVEIGYIPLEKDLLIRLDEGYYFSILDNLISNAIKFNDHLHKTIRLSWEQKAEQYCLKVEDNGRGIDSSDRNALFTAFYRGQSSVGKPGLGLGLYYVKSCLDRLGWTIRIENSLSGGTIFYIYMDNGSFNSKKQD